jgi:hypothetical protein
MCRTPEKNRPAPAELILFSQVPSNFWMGRPVSYRCCQIGMTSGLSALTEHRKHCIRLLSGYHYKRKLVGKIWERTPESGNEAKSHRINGPRVFVCSHNPKVVSSNLTPATNLRCARPEPRIPAFSFVQVMKSGSSSFLRAQHCQDLEPDSHRPVLVCHCCQF